MVNLFEINIFFDSRSGNEQYAQFCFFSTLFMCQTAIYFL